MVKRAAGWDDAKAAENWRKHRVTFHEAELVLGRDPLVETYRDEEHRDRDDRWYAIGQTEDQRVLFIVYAIRNDKPWIISARHASTKEIRRYMRGDRIRDREAVQPARESNAGRERTTVYCIQRMYIDEDVAQFYFLDEQVNEALRALIDEGRAPAPLDIEFDIPPEAIDLDWWGPEEFETTGKTPAHIGPILPPPRSRTCVSVWLDLTRYFPDETAVNDALRQLIAEGRVPPRPNE